MLQCAPWCHPRREGGLVLLHLEPGSFPSPTVGHPDHSALFLLQSSGNVWVTHEEMENMATSTKTVRLGAPLPPRRIGYRAELRACINVPNPRREGDLGCVSCVSSWPAHCTCLETVFQPLISQQFLKLA